MANLSSAFVLSNLYSTDWPITIAKHNVATKFYYGTSGNSFRVVQSTGTFTVLSSNTMPETI